ncbi:MAG: hypothetical protein ACR2GD_08800 [Pyrinomonadaceae bacterium]
MRLMEFGDNSINMQLWVWTKEKLQRKTVLLSDLNFAIWEKFRANDIEIPFPQTDLHIKSGKLELKKEAIHLDNAESSDDGTELENFDTAVTDENDRR